MKLSGDKLQKRITVFIWLCVFVYTCLPLFTNKLFDAHDISYHLNRIDGIGAALRNGQFPVRIHPNILNDYGYANSIFYPELFLYLPGALRALGVNVSICYKILIGMINAFAVSISLFSFKRIFRSTYAAYTGTVLYGLSLYRLLCIYVRGAVGEALAMSFLPLAALGIYEIFVRNPRKWHYLAIAFACILQSHIITAELLLYTCIIMAVFYIPRLAKDRLRRVLAAVKAAVITLLLNIWFLVPFFEFVREGVKITDTDVTYWKNTVNPPTKIFAFLFPVSRTQGARENMPYSIGFSLFVLLIIFIVLCLLRNRGRMNTDPVSSNDKNLFYLGRSGFITAAVCMFMSTYLFPWYLFTYVPFLNRIASSMQFPWRLLSIGSAAACVTAVAVCMLLKKKRGISGKILFVSVSLAALLCANVLIDSVITYMPYFGNSGKFLVYAPVDDPSWVYDGQYSLKSTDIKLLTERGEIAIPSHDSISVSEVSRKGGTLSVDFTADSPSDSDYIEVPISWYPHYISEIDGEEAKNEPGENNVIRVYTEGRSSGNICVKWKSPLLYRICELVSLTTLILFVLNIQKRRLAYRRFLFS